MLPGKLEDGNFITLIRRWREMWNTLLREHLNSMRLIAGKGIRIQHYPNGTVISADRTSAAAVPAAAQEDEYSGCFKIVDVSTGEEHRIMVVDGESYDAAEKSSGPSLYRINSGVLREIGPWTSGPVSAINRRNQYVVLQYHHDGREEHVSIRLMENLPPLDNNAGCPTLQYYLIGYVVFYNNAMHITQSHRSGIIAMTGCGPSAQEFGITAFYEPVNDDGRLGPAKKIRVNGGSIYIGGQYLTLAQQEYDAFEDGAAFRIFLSVHATVSADNSAVTYTAEFYPARNGVFPPGGFLYWYTDIGRVEQIVHQSKTGIITVSGVWV